MCLIHMIVSDVIMLLESVLCDELNRTMTILWLGCTAESLFIYVSRRHVIPDIIWQWGYQQELLHRNKSK